MHGKRILKLLQKIFSWLPLATVIDQKVLVLHGGISDTTDLSILAKLDRHNVRRWHVQLWRTFSWQANTDMISLFISNTIPEISPLVYSQYVSALRPPKRRNQRSAGTSIDSDMDDDVWSSNRIFQRRTSLTFPKPLGTRNSFQNRSLQDFSDRIKLTADEEVDMHRRKQCLLNFGQSHKESSSTSSECLNSDNSKEELKQVMTEQKGCSDIWVTLVYWKVNCIIGINNYYIKMDNIGAP